MIKVISIFHMPANQIWQLYTGTLWWAGGVMDPNVGPMWAIASVMMQH